MLMKFFEVNLLQLRKIVLANLINNNLLCIILRIIPSFSTVLITLYIAIRRFVKECKNRNGISSSDRSSLVIIELIA